MTIAIARDPIYRNRRFQSEIIELCVRWYLTYRLSYRDLVEMMAERGIVISHSTILRWVQRYVPEFERRLARYARRINSSWRMDETAVSVRGGCCGKRIACGGPSSCAAVDISTTSSSRTIERSSAAARRCWP